MDRQPWFTAVQNVFRLDSELDREGMVSAIRTSLEFRGTNVWSLVLAIFVASIGLNLNSPAIIIGAMLISPLMGPITGAGMALGIYDLGLLRRSLANLALMTVISLLASTLYFWLTPLKDTTTELLNRTTPTFFDVLIALFGGAALMVGLSQKTKSTNLLAGVAIATALMPPVCTAGFGLANQNWGIFTGAVYLYLINSVFIGLATFLFSKGLSLWKVTSVATPEPARLRKRHWALTAVAMLVFVAPSLYFAYDVVQSSGWRQRLDQYISTNFVFTDSQVVSTKVVGLGSNKTLEVVLVGAPLSADLKEHLTRQLETYQLTGLTLKFLEPQTTPPSAGPLAIAPKLPELADVTKELEVLFPSLGSVAWGDLTSQPSAATTPQSETIVFVRWRTEASAGERQRLEGFLRLRLHTATFRLVHEVLAPPPPS